MLTIEYPIRNASISVLWNSVGTALGLSEWFADVVTVAGNEYTFAWDDNEQTAILIDKKPNSFIRFQWAEDMNATAFFEIKISKEAITRGITLVVTDFANPDEMDDLKLLWDKQINELKRKIGI